MDDTDRNYARVGHIYQRISEPRIDTRGLGQTLVLLAELDVLAVLATRSNTTIYDLTTYYPARLTAIGRLLDVSNYVSWFETLGGSRAGSTFRGRGLGLLLG